MAEADVEIRPNNPRFFCYKCNLQISHILDDYTCPTCKSGFIEEVPPGANPSNHTQTHEPMDLLFGTGSGSDSNPNHGIMDPLAFVNAMLQFDGNPLSPGPTQNASPAPLLANLLGRSGPRGTATAHPRSGGQSPGSHQISFVINARPRHQGPGESGGSAGHTPHGNAENPMENALYSFLTDLITGLGGGVGVAGGIPLLGNLGDYVWGRDGLDAIVTQLMNQMEGTGPPPLSTDKLENLVSTSITQDQVDKKLQCSVCWEDFAVGDEVKQLECDHVYHPDCIVPWLKLHGTCPVCRKDLTGSAGGQDDARASSPSFTADSSANHSTEGNIRNRFASSSSTNPDEHSTNPNNQYVSRGRGRGSGPGQHGPGNLDTMDFDFD